MKVNIQATPTFEKNWVEYQSKKHKIVLNAGGTGSGKTYGLAQLFNLMLLNEKGKKITISRKYLPALRATAMEDFFAIMKQAGLYRKEWHNKSDNTYIYPPSGSKIDFISVDMPTKVRSRRRDYLWLNEMNEFTREDFRQLSMRTNEQIFGDYNPSDQFHWIYDDLESRDDVITIQSTYKDNPFLPTEIIKEIEGFKDTDQNYWRIYGLGLKGLSQNNVYNHQQLCDKMPSGGETIYGLDFGYTAPLALIEVRWGDGEIHTDELIYQSHLTMPELIEKFKDLKIPKDKYIFADNSEPDRIKDLQNAGYNVLPAVKSASGADRSILLGIESIRKKKWYITKRSTNIQREARSYSYKTNKMGDQLEDPVKVRDHAMDAIRYAVYSYEDLTSKFIGFI